MARELASYRLGLVGFQEVKWEKEGQGTVNHPAFNRFFLRQLTQSAVKTKECLSDRVPYIYIHIYIYIYIYLHIHKYIYTYI